MTERLRERKIDRRTFLKASAGALALSVLGGKTGADCWCNLGYVDAHSHLWSPDRTHYPLVPTGKEEDVGPFDFADRAGDRAGKSKWVRTKRRRQSPSGIGLVRGRRRSCSQDEPL